MQNRDFKILTGKDGGIASLVINGDAHELNWLDGEKVYGTPYGKYAFMGAEELSSHEMKAVYSYKELTVTVTRRLTDSGLAESYSFKNATDKDLTFKTGDLGICACFNDNYDEARVALDKKCHMHIWTGGNTTYIQAKRMNGEGDNVALICSKGAFVQYAVERLWNSNDRGDIFLLLPEMTIKAGDKYECEIGIFRYEDDKDFIIKALVSENFLHAVCDKYTVADGEKVKILLRSLTSPKLYYGDEEITLAVKDKLTYVGEYTFGDGAGAKRLDIRYGEDGGKYTYIDVNVVSGVLDIIDKRLNFIVDKQQCVKRGVFNGSIMLYDNETERTFVENRPINDRNIARERVGMTCALLRRILLGKGDEEALSKFRGAAELSMNFIDRAIVNCRGNVFEAPVYKKSIFMDRLYNYSMYMTVYILAYKVFGAKKYLDKAYAIAKRYYKKGGIKFYAINIPMTTMYECAKESGYISMADDLKSMFLAHGDRIFDISSNYPAHEVKYEQSIVAPSVDTLLECYLLSEDKKYLDEAEKQLRLLEAFNGHQPSYHMNEVSIRHWDGFWFGKRKMYGDTFPHYWSCITAAVFAKYAAITGKSEYARKADICLENNLCLFNEEGRGSCAYVYPLIINGRAGAFYDPWANDQDWALYFNLRYNSELV